MSFNARTFEQQAAICHCKECKTDIFYSLELGLNVVALHLTLNDIQNLKKLNIIERREAFVKLQQFKKMKHYTLPDGSMLFISIWCPTCNRIQNKDVYIPNWKKVN